MRRQLGDRERMRLLASSLAERVTTAHVNRRTSLQVWQPEVNAPIAAVGCAEQTEERLILIDRQKLPVAERPALRWKHETHDSDFRQEWFGHRFLLLA